MFTLFRNMSFRWKLTLPLALLAALFCTLGVVATVAVSDLSSRLSLFSSQLLPQATNLLEADRDLYQALIAERAFVQGAEPEEFSALAAEHADNLQQAIDRVSVFASTTTSGQGKAMAQQFNEAFNA